MNASNTDVARRAIVEQLFLAFRNKDRRVAESLLADDFLFTSPFDDAIDRTAYFEHCWPESERICEQVIERLVVDGDGAYVTYLAQTHQGSSFRNTEFFNFRDERIVRIDVYFGVAYRNGVFAAQKPG